MFDRLAAEAVAAYDRIMGLDLDDVCVDGSQHKAPCGGEGTGPNPTDRGRKGWKWSIATDKAGIPLGWAADGANRHDIPLLKPTLAFVEQTGLLDEIETLHLDRGYDANTVRDLLGELGIDVCGHKPANVPAAPPSAKAGCLLPSDCVGRFSAPTPGCPTTGRCDATPTASPSTGSRSSPWQSR